LPCSARNMHFVTLEKSFVALVACEICFNFGLKLTVCWIAVLMNKTCQLFFPAKQ
jgi:hypothetical protein